MATYLTPAPRLAGTVVALPRQRERNEDLVGTLGAQVTRDIIRSTGIESRPVARGETVASLGEQAARELLARLDWDPAGVGALIVVTQTPDYPLPATSCLLQQALSLPESVIALDLNLGCAGHVQGLAVLTSLMQTAGIRRALLVCGDITSRMIAPEDRALRPLFGDAVAVTALESDPQARLSFDLGTDGTGAPYLMSPAGGTRQPGPPQLRMDGVQVMAFSLRRVAPSVARSLDAIGMGIQDMDAVVLHQANAMMINTLGRKLGASPAQLVNTVRDYGNTSSCSIPLALCEHLAQAPIASEPLRLLLCGFGVGWSWASAAWVTPAPTVSVVVTSS